MVTGRRGGDVTEAILAKLHAGQEFVRTGSRYCFGTADYVVCGASCSAKRGLFETRQVTENLLVMLVAEAITCAVRCQRLKVNVTVSFFDVIYFESKVVGLVYNKAKVFVVEVSGS